jgi:hypothetical protein
MNRSITPVDNRQQRIRRWVERGLVAVTALYLVGVLILLLWGPVASWIGDATPIPIRFKVGFEDFWGGWVTIFAALGGIAALRQVEGEVLFDRSLGVAIGKDMVIGALVLAACGVMFDRAIPAAVGVWRQGVFFARHSEALDQAVAAIPPQARIVAGPAIYKRMRANHPSTILLASLPKNHPLSSYDFVAIDLLYSPSLQEQVTRLLVTPAAYPYFCDDRIMVVSMKGSDTVNSATKHQAIIDCLARSWRYTADRLTTMTGVRAYDFRAESGRALRAKIGKVGYLVMGPYTAVPAGSYVATFSLRAEGGTPIAGAADVEIDIAADQGRLVPASQRISIHDIPRNGMWKPFSLPFTLDVDVADLETRVKVFGSGGVRFDAVQIKPVGKYQ